MFTWCRIRVVVTETTTISSPHIVDNENNFEHEYSAIKIYNKSEIIKKGKGGGEQREQQDEQQQEQQDYLNDPYPFTAFKISRSPYSESSLSGNIYCGTYNSVKDSFPLQNLNLDSPSY